MPTPVSLSGKFHGQRSLVGCSPWGREESGTTKWLHFHFSLSCIGEGNGNPLQYSCLGNSVDRGAWWAAVYRVAQSWTQLEQLSMHACIGEGNGNPLLFSCLENPMDRGAWQAIVHRVAKSWTRLKQLSTHATMHSHPGKWRQFQLEKARKIYIIKVVIVWWVPSSKGPGLPFMTRVLGLWICLSGNWLKG